MKPLPLIRIVVFASLALPLAEGGIPGVELGPTQGAGARAVGVPLHRYHLPADADFPQSLTYEGM
ncbi:MAG: hypothetical protein AAF211_09590, partial [Myxococcota bacterium]